MSATSEPLKKQRLLALAIGWAWNIVAACVGLNALIKFVHCRTSMGSISHISRSNQTETYFRKIAPPGVTLKFDINGTHISRLCHYLRLVVHLRRCLSNRRHRYDNLRNCGRYHLNTLRRHAHQGETLH